MRVAVLGLGEAGTCFARDLIDIGVEVSGWDPVAKDPVKGIVFAASNLDAVLNADAIFSMNSASVAYEVADEVVPALCEGQIYAEMNTGSPGLKREIASLVESTGAVLADVAIMAPVPPKGMRTPLWTSGSGAEAFRERMVPLGMSVEVLPGSAGTAATYKLVRSIAYKGIAAVIVECLQAARRLGLESYARTQLATLVDEGMIDRFEAGSRKHASRRIHEMEAVQELLDSVGVRPHTSVAALRTLRDLENEEE